MTHAGHKTGALRDKILKLRQDHPNMRAIRIAEELNVSRERVRQVLTLLDLRTTIVETPHRKVQHRTKTGYKPKPVMAHKPLEVTTNVDLLPKVCPKCSGTQLYRETFPEGWELKCSTCNVIVAFSHKQEAELYRRTK